MLGTLIEWILLTRLREKRQPKSSDSFDKEPFFRALSYRDFLTSFALAIFLMAFLQILLYYSIEDWIRDYFVSIRMVSFLLVGLMNHMIYKIEHRRANNFVGRIVHDFIFIIMFFLLGNLRTYILYGTISDVENGALPLIGVVMLVLIFEFSVAILKRLLRLFKWQIL